MGRSLPGVEHDEGAEAGMRWDPGGLAEVVGTSQRCSTAGELLLHGWHCHHHRLCLERES